MYQDFDTLESLSLNEAAIRNSIKNILLTRRGSVPARPDFGSDLHLILFSMIDNATAVLAKNYIFDALTKFENRIKVRDSKVTFDEAYNRIIISIDYTVVNDVVNQVDNIKRITFPYDATL